MRGNRNTGVYRITIGPRVYFGQSKNLKERRKEHLSRLRRGAHRNKRMQHAFNNGEAYAFEVLVFVSADSLDAVEQALLDAYADDPKSMNVARDASNPGRNPSPETRARISAAGMGKFPSAETRALLRVPKSTEARANMSAAQKGKTFSVETRAKISASKTGRKHSTETLAKMSIAQKKRYHDSVGQMPTIEQQPGRPSFAVPTTKKEST